MYVLIDTDNGGSSSITSSDHAHCEDDRSSPFGTFPKRYDKSYRISFSVMTDDLAYRLRQLQQRREDDGRRCEMKIAPAKHITKSTLRIHNLYL